MIVFRVLNLRETRIRLCAFRKKFSVRIFRSCLLYTKNLQTEGDLWRVSVYMTSLLNEGVSAKIS